MFQKGEGPKKGDDAKILCGRSNRLFKLLPIAQSRMTAKISPAQTRDDSLKKDLPELLSPTKADMGAARLAVEKRKEENTKKRKQPVA